MTKKSYFIYNCIMLTFIFSNIKYAIIQLGDFMDKYAFGNFLAELRNEKGLTQEQLSEMINVNYKTISKWECGNSLPSLDVLAQLSEIFNVSLYEMSIYKRIKNPFISKNDINKIINKQSITKFIIIKIILLILLIILIIFTTYSCIYTINNYNQVKIYELASEDDDVDIGGLFVQSHEQYYLTISHINFLDSKENYINDKTKSLKYNLLANGKIIESNNISFEKETSIKNAVSLIKIYVSKNSIINNITKFDLQIKYESNEGIDKKKQFIINFSRKITNKKVFY